MNLKSIIQNNPDAWFVVWMKNEEETKKVYEVLESLGYQCTIPLKPFKEMWDNACKEYGHCFGVKIKCYNPDCSWNDSLDHWKEYTNDILEFKTGDELGFIEEDETTGEETSV